MFPQSDLDPSDITQSASVMLAVTEGISLFYRFRSNKIFAAINLKLE